MRGLVVGGVGKTVDLHGEAQARAVEVEHVGANRVLTSELEAAQLTTPKLHPEPSFWRREGSAQPVRIGERGIFGARPRSHALGTLSGPSGHFPHEGEESL